MKEIKFSYNYDKLGDLRHFSIAILLQVFKTHYNELSRFLIEDDTSYFDQGKMGNYPLPKTDLILLIFRGYNGKMFTTIRRYTPQKWEYYKNSEGEDFKVIVGEAT